jgi:hypothetical protein
MLPKNIPNHFHQEAMPNLQAAYLGYYEYLNPETKKSYTKLNTQNQPSLDRFPM